MNQERYSCR